MAHFALQKLRILPSVLANMDNKELAFIYGSIQIRVEEEKRHAKEIKSRARSLRKGGRR